MQYHRSRNSEEVHQDLHQPDRGEQITDLQMLTRNHNRQTRLASLWFGLTMLHFFLVSACITPFCCTEPCSWIPRLTCPVCPLHCTLWHCLANPKVAATLTLPTGTCTTKGKDPKVSHHPCVAARQLQVKEEEDAIRWGGFFWFCWSWGFKAKGAADHTQNSFLYHRPSLKGNLGVSA